MSSFVTHFLYFSWNLVITSSPYIGDAKSKTIQCSRLMVLLTKSHRIIATSKHYRLLTAMLYTKLLFISLRIHFR